MDYSISSNINIFNYPPTEDQLKIIDSLYKYLDSSFLLILLRILSLILLILSVVFVYKIIEKIASSRVGIIMSIFIVISPVFLVTWTLHPFDCIKIFFVSVIFYCFFNKKKIFISPFLIFSLLYLLFFNFLVKKDTSSFFHKLGFVDSKSETITRFGQEDVLQDPVFVPLKVKRLVYNKYFILEKELLAEFIPFFDLETIFFQEVHPMEQKSVVIFYWPEIILFLLGIYFIFNVKNNLKKPLFAFFVISFVNFLFTNAEPYRKFVFILFPISILLAFASDNLLSIKKNIWKKNLAYLLFFMVFYGYITNMFDVNKRSDYWVNNRPLYFEYVYKTLKNKNVNQYDKVYIGTLVGDAKLYCRFYLKNCSSDKFVFGDLDVDNKVNKKIYYAGYVGEYIGSDFKNNINENWKYIIESKNINIISVKKLRDTIAYKYGNEIVISEKLR